MLLKQALQTLESADAGDRPFLEADFLELQRKPRSAIRALAPALASEDVRIRAAALLYRGRLLQSMYATEKALNDFRAAAQVGSDHYLHAVTAQLGALCELHRIDEARGLLEPLIRSLPAQVDQNALVLIENALVQLLNTYEKTGQHVAAATLRDLAMQSPANLSLTSDRQPD